MCGRFTLTADPIDLQATFPDFGFPQTIIKRYNIAPSQPVLVLPNDGTNKADYYLWGLIPSWAQDPTFGSHLINARAETLAEKPSFRSAYKYHRCVIFATGFFEWQMQEGSQQKKPYYIQLRSGMPFAMAGLWDHWKGKDGSEILSTVIITTGPNELTSPIHNRMPAILPPDAYTKWLEVTPLAPRSLSPLLVPYPASELVAYPVSYKVNNPAYEDEGAIEKAS